MDVVRMFPGAPAPDTDNRITVKAREDGKYEFIGVVGDPRIALNLDPRVFDTVTEAREAAVLWAEGEGASRVFLVMPDA